MALGGFLNMLQTERGPSMPERLMLTSTGSNVLEVAADKTTFKLLAEIGAAYDYIHRVPNSGGRSAGTGAFAAACYLPSGREGRNPLTEEGLNR